MTPQEKGRFCGNCEKTIIDYSHQPDRVIAQAIKDGNGQICGRFRTDQLQRDIVLEPQFYQNTRWKAFGLMLSGLLAAGTLKGQEVPICTETLTLNENHCKTDVNNGIIISGRVIDAHSEKGLIGVSVMLKEVETTTDLEGYFAIKVFSEQEISKMLNSGFLLKIDYIDYIAERIIVTKKQLKEQLSKEGKYLNSVNVSNLDIPVFYVPTAKLYLTSCGKSDGFITIASQGNHITMGSISAPSVDLSLWRKKVPLSLTTSSEEENWIELRRSTLWKRTIPLNFFRKEKKEPKKENTPSEAMAYAAIEPSIQQISKDKQPQDRELPFIPKIIQKIYPNPFKDELTIEIKVEQAETYDLVLFNELGQEIHRKTVAAISGINQFTLHLNEKKLATGTYLLSILNGKEILQTEIVIRQD
jgi:hypothetical protein